MLKQPAKKTAAQVRTAFDVENVFVIPLRKLVSSNTLFILAMTRFGRELISKVRASCACCRFISLSVICSDHDVCALRVVAFAICCVKCVPAGLVVENSADV